MRICLVATFELLRIIAVRSSSLVAVFSDNIGDPGRPAFPQLRRARLEAFPRRLILSNNALTTSSNVRKSYIVSVQKIGSHSTHMVS